MNRNQFFILLILVAVLGGAGLVLSKKQRASWSGGSAGVGKKLFKNFPLNDVAHIVIRQGAHEVNLARKDDVWRVRERNDYPANFQAISEFLLKVRALKATQMDQVGPSQLPRLELAAGQGSNAATIVEFKSQDEKVIGALWLGKKQLRKSSQPSPLGEGGDEGFAVGRYVKTGADSGDVATISDPLENIEPKPEQWLSKEFLRVEKPRFIEVTFPAATNSWKLTRETEAGDWKLADAKPEEQLDPTKVSGVASPFSGTSFNDVLPGGKPDESGTNRGTLMKIETFDNFVYTVKTAGKTNEDYLLNVAVTAQIPKERVAGSEEKPEDKAKLDQEFKARQQKLEEKLKQEQSYEKWTYLVQAWGIDSLLKERSQLLAEKEGPQEGINAADAAGSKAEEPKVEVLPLPGTPK